MGVLERAFALCFDSILLTADFFLFYYDLPLVLRYPGTFSTLFLKPRSFQGEENKMKGIMMYLEGTLTWKLANSCCFSSDGKITSPMCLIFSINRILLHRLGHPLNFSKNDSPDILLLYNLPPEIYNSTFFKAPRILLSRLHCKMHSLIHMWAINAPR